MKQGEKQGKRKRGVGLAAGIAAIATMAFGGSTAQAAPQALQATFDDAALDIGVAIDVLNPPNQATIGVAHGTSTFDPATDEFIVPADDFVFPTVSGEPLPGVSVSVSFEAVDPIIGKQTNGDVTTNLSTYRTSVSVNMAPPCVYQADLVFTTDDVAGAPFTGDPFTVVLGPPTTITEGNLQASWVPGVWGPALGGDCATVDGLIGGLPGGVAIASGLPAPLVGPAADQTPVATSSAVPTTTLGTKKKCKKGFVKKKVKGKRKCVRKKKRK